MMSKAIKIIAIVLVMMIVIGLVFALLFLDNDVPRVKVEAGNNTITPGENTGTGGNSTPGGCTTPGESTIPDDNGNMSENNENQWIARDDVITGMYAIKDSSPNFPAEFAEYDMLLCLYFYDEDVSADSIVFVMAAKSSAPTTWDIMTLDKRVLYWSLDFDMTDTEQSYDVEIKLQDDVVITQIGYVGSTVNGWEQFAIKYYVYCAEGVEI